MQRLGRDARKKKRSEGKEERICRKGSGTRAMLALRGLSFYFV